MNRAHIVNCYAAGAVFGGLARGRGLVGISDPNLAVASFWDVNATDQASSATGIGIKTDQMQSASTFIAAGWDFENVWEMCGQASEYPKLRSCRSPLVGDFVCPDVVDLRDFTEFASEWRRGNNSFADLDGSGSVNWADLVVFCDNYLTKLPSMKAEPLTLHALGPTVISEGADDLKIRARIGRTGDLSSDMEILLQSSDPNELYVPNMIILYAGSSFEDFIIHGRNDGEMDGDKEVVIIAQSADRIGFLRLTVKDDDTVDRRTIGGNYTDDCVLEPRTYHVTDDLTISPESTLTIPPGTTLRFTPKSGLFINGTVTAIASPEETAIFTSAVDVPTRGDWSGIVMKGSSAALEIQHGEVAFAVTGIKLDLAESADVDLVLYNCDIHHCLETGVHIDSSPGMNITAEDARVTQTRIRENERYGIMIEASSYVSTYACPLGRCCGGSVRSANGAYIAANDILDNDIGICILNPFSGGGYCPGGIGGTLNAQIIGNRIIRNRCGIGPGDSPQESISATITNNLIAGNTESGVEIYQGANLANNTIVNNGGAGIYHARSLRSLINNAIVGNASGVVATEVMTPNAGSEWPIGFNDVCANIDANWINYPPSYGNMTTTNANGVSADVHMNISVDPLFVSAEDYHLRSSSPLIGAGTYLNGITPEYDFDGDLRLEPLDIGFDEATQQ